MSFTEFDRKITQMRQAQRASRIAAELSAVPGIGGIRINLDNHADDKVLFEVNGGPVVTPDPTLNGQAEPELINPTIPSNVVFESTHTTATTDAQPDRPSDKSPKKRKRKAVTPPDPNLDPFTAPPEEVVKTPEGRERAKEVIATITLENHIVHGVEVDAEVMEKAASILTGHVPRRQLAERLTNVRASRSL